MLWRLLLLTLLLAGCSSTPEAPFASPVAPEDFSVDLTVRPGPAYPLRPAVHLRPGRFVLFPDGSLHHGTSGDPQDLPEQVRTLDRVEVESVWRRLDALGFRAQDAGHTPINFALVQPPADGIAYLVAIAGGGERRVFLIAGDAGDPRREAAIALVRLLARYAWATDELPSVVRVRPRRYDFGPDPYARYRVSDDQGAAEDDPDDADALNGENDDDG